VSLSSVFKIAGHLLLWYRVIENISEDKKCQSKIFLKNAALCGFAASVALSYQNKKSPDYDDLHLCGGKKYTWSKKSFGQIGDTMVKKLKNRRSGVRSQKSGVMNYEENNTFLCATADSFVFFSRI